MTFPRNIPALVAAATLALAVLWQTAINSQNMNVALISAAGFPMTPTITKTLIPEGTLGRHQMKKMVPRYITIHSTQNYSKGADAAAHARLIQRGGLTSRHNSLGYLTWHFSVDEDSIHQSLPCTEQGQHADYDGPGNQSSIGIEMCENADNSREKTLEQTAKLTAWLMARYNIPINHVVPHQHWRRIRPTDQKDLGHKNCPHFLMDNGVPGAKWEAFLDRVRSYR
ncbi:MAG: peptidoglycan recognition family protein [Verrucomicrobiales bacterium]|nr:peptidoglycan recognition family protein [Verrucomicrobiales bacterium]